MGTPTSIEVSVDDTEYSRYESDRDTITCSVVVTGGAPYTTEQVLVELTKARRSRDAVVATATITITAGIDPQEATATFYLPDIVDQDLIHLARFGKYFVKASSITDEDIYGETDDFDIRIITVERFKEEYLFGINLQATEIKEPKIQPQTITGVEVTQVSNTHPLGFSTLTYNYHEDHTANATAAIGSGLDGTVTITADEDNAGECGNDITVQVVVPAGTSSLSVSFAANVLVISLDVTAGVPNAAANTATLIAAAIDAEADFSAVASGTGADSISVAEGPTQFSGGTTTTVRQLSWDGGTSVSITATGNYILRKGSTGPKAKLFLDSNDYICVKVRSLLLLPTTADSVAEELLITKKVLDDESLCRYLDEAVSWVEKAYLQVHVEPTNVVTERDPTTIQFSAGVNAPNPLFTDTDFDFIVSPLTYFLPRPAGWVTIQTPFPQLLRVDSLFGAIANVRVIDIDLEWIEHSEQGGLLQLVPFNQEIAFDFVGLLWVNAIRGATELPNFWHFNMITGLRECTPDIREVIAKKAAIRALVVAGLALRPGVTSSSLSRDGVSESVSYTTSAQYGVYTGTIQAYKEWIEDAKPGLRAKYRGPLLSVV